MMTVYNIHEAKTKFSMLINKTLDGEEVIIAKGGNPVAKLIPYKEELTERKSGQFSGIMQPSDDFDAPMTEEELNLFYEGDIFKE